MASALKEVVIVSLSLQAAAFSPLAFLEAMRTVERRPSISAGNNNDTPGQVTFLSHAHSALWPLLRMH